MRRQRIGEREVPKRQVREGELGERRVREWQPLPNYLFNFLSLYLFIIHLFNQIHPGPSPNLPMEGFWKVNKLNVLTYTYTLKARKRTSAAQLRHATSGHWRSLQI